MAEPVFELKPDSIPQFVISIFTLDRFWINYIAKLFCTFKFVKQLNLFYILNGLSLFMITTNMCSGEGVLFHTWVGKPF